MSNNELIETARQAMKDLWDINQGRLLEHEQTAYNCLRLFCDRFCSDEADRIEKLQSENAKLKEVIEIVRRYAVIEYGESASCRIIASEIQKATDNNKYS